MGIMGKTKVEEIVFDEDINIFSQLRLAEWMIDRKKWIYKKDVKTTINGIEFDTIGCDNTQDFIDKHQSLFEQIGLPNYDIRKVQGGNDIFRTINIDNFGTLTTRNCYSIEDFKSINSKRLNLLSQQEQEKYIQIALNCITKSNLEQLLANRDALKKRLIVLERNKMGKVSKVNGKTQKTPSYTERKAEIEKEIIALKTQQEKYDNKLFEDIFEEDIDFSKMKLETILSIPGRFNTDEEEEVLQQYYDVINDSTEKGNQLVTLLETVEKLPQSSGIKLLLIDILVKTINEQLNNLQQKYDKIVKEEQSAISYIEPLMNQTQKELENLDVEIEKLHQELAKLQTKKETQNNPSSKTTTKEEFDALLTKLASEGPIMKEHEEDFDIISEKDGLMQVIKKTIEDFYSKLNKDNILEELKGQNLYNLLEDLVKDEKNEEEQNFGYSLNPENEKKALRQVIKNAISAYRKEKSSKKFEGDDFYNLLKNVAAEGPIMKEHEENFDLIPEDNKPHIIQSIKKAPTKLRSKIRDSKLVKKITEILSKMKKHRIGIAIATTVLTVGTIGAGLGISNTTKELNANDETIEQSIEDSQAIVTNNLRQKVAIGISALEEKTEEEEFNEDLEATLNNVLGGNTKVHISVDRAANGIDAKIPSKSSWENATPGAFYNMEDGRANELTQEEAQDYLQDGGQVIVRMDNGDTPIGFVPVEQQQENNTGKSM